ncbi:MAG TPA: carbamoyltransferase HypF [Solirubrobacteraceae bacterium]|nr:carbamoyltransferase HypF [Solirubrobacteraceae bacterium]
MPAAGAATRVRTRVEGTVQGVGFRPFVYRLAGELGLAGWVRNDEHGVELEVEGEAQAVEAFLARLSTEAPPLAQVERVRAEARTAQGEQGFTIAASGDGHAEADALVTPDAATCGDCLAELFDPSNRRFGYPFINCTNCGPRFTIVRGVPYDRALTTMAGFEMCAECRAEYEEPGDRRFHAQPNACAVCGPQVRLVTIMGKLALPTPDTPARTDTPATAAALAATGGDRSDSQAITRAANLLAQGAIVAIKGLGGYHLACRADDELVVGRLRARKRREDRPFALMVAGVAAAGRIAHTEDEEEALLQSTARPIVLARRRKDAGAAIARSVAPGASELGVMLAYTPLHHLLLSALNPLGVQTVVMTSGNVSDEPIAYEDEDALERLASIADAMLLHDRPIHMRTDDSVVRAVQAGEQRCTQTLRRSRGYVPAGLRLRAAARRPLLACGAELKSTFCVARGERAWVSHHIGDLGNWETLRSFREGVAHFERLFAVTPEVIVHDLHPSYLSTAYAQDREQSEEVELLAVQHHHAHFAAVLAEHGESGRAVGAIYDGAGYGTDGGVWGGELLVGDLTGFKRAGHLRAVRLPGGDRAVREPWRMACAWVAEATGDRVPPIPPGLSERVDPSRWEAVARIAHEGVAAPLTTSAGRLCDAVAALCGVRAEVSYEGQAAIELEAMADPDEHGEYELPYKDGQLDPRPAIVAIIGDLAGGASTAIVSARFHNGLAAASVRACTEIAEATGVALVVLAGGVFQNRLLLERVAKGVHRAGVRVLTPKQLPPNDGAISFGQAAIAAARSTLV